MAMAGAVWAMSPMTSAEQRPTDPPPTELLTLATSHSSSAETTGHALTFHHRPEATPQPTPKLVISSFLIHTG